MRWGDCASTVTWSSAGPRRNPLAEGATSGGGGGIELELACDPVEGGPVLARGQSGALSILAAALPGGMTPCPAHVHEEDGGRPGRQAAASTCARASAENLEAIADAFGRRVADITAIVLDRPRHDDLIAEIREAGARIKLIPDGDITATIDAAVRGTNDHLAIGIGGALGGIISAAALRCLGGEIQGQLWPMSRTEIKQAAEYGISDISADLRHRRSGPRRRDRRRLRHLQRRPAARRALRRRGRADALDRPLLALQQGALRRLDPPLLARPARRDPPVTEEPCSSTSCTISPASVASRAIGG